MQRDLSPAARSWFPATVAALCIGLLVIALLALPGRGADDIAESVSLEVAAAPATNALANLPDDGAASDPAPTAPTAPTADPTPTSLPVIDGASLPVLDAPAPTAEPTATPAPQVAPTATPEPEPTTEATAVATATTAPVATAEPEATAAPVATTEPEATAAPVATAETETTSETTTTDPVVTEGTTTSDQQFEDVSDLFVKPEETTTVTTTTAPGTSAPVPAELPAYSSGGSFTNVLLAKPGTSRAVIYDEPGGQQLQVTYEYLDGSVVRNDLVNPTYNGNTLSLRVIRGAPGDAWAMVELPTRPNGQTGWIQTEAYNWSSSNSLVRINITTNTVTILNGDSIVLESSAVTGAPSSPTPVLRGYVDEKVTSNLQPWFGTGIVSLGVFSNALNTFGANGEAPKIALHGTDQPHLMGRYESNGCIRVPNDIINEIIATVPVGSIVEIVQ